MQIKKVQRQRPAGIRNMSIIVFLGALFSAFLLLFSTAGSSDFYFLIADVLLGIITAYGLWTLQFWAFWFTAAYETYEIIYELFLLTQPDYWNWHIVLPLAGVIASAIGLIYIFFDRTVKPAFSR